jgi:hypothetical protein
VVFDESKNNFAWIPPVSVQFMWKECLAKQTKSLRMRGKEWTPSNLESVLFLREKVYLWNVAKKQNKKKNTLER